MTRRTTLDLGHRIDDDALVRLPDQLVTEATAVIGRRGSGKTNTGRVLAEGLHHCGQQVVILDPLDAWWGLKTGADGDADHGLPILVIGDERRPHTDLPLRPEDGQLIADFLVDERVSAILSLRHLSKKKTTSFVADFAERIYERKGDPGRNTPCCLFVDEAATLVPQQIPPQNIDAARAVGAIQSWVRQGRSSGIGCVLIDQRPASVNKDALTQVEVLLCGQLIYKHDRKAVQDWVEANDLEGNLKPFMDSLGGLQTGGAWLWSPGWLKVFQRVAVKLADTFDSSKTPSLDDAGFVPTDLAAVDLDAFRDRLADAVEQAKTNDPKALKARIAELEQQLSQGEVRTAADIKALTQRARDAGHQQGVREAQKAAQQQLAELVEKLGAIHQLVTKGVKSLSQVYAEFADIPTAELAPTPQLTPDPAPVHSPPPTRQPAPSPRKPTAPAFVPSADQPEGFAPRHQKILNAIARLEAIGVPEPKRSVAAAMAGVSPKSSGYDKTLSNLKTMGLIEHPGHGRLRLTDDGRALTQPHDTPITLDELHKAWRRSPMLSPRHLRVLEPLITAHPGELTRDQIAEASGYSINSSGFDKTVSSLSSMGLIDYPAPGHVRATALLFPEGLA